MAKIARDLDWEDLRSFAALAEAGTLSAAARRLRVTHATVSRRLAALERALGEALFDRRPDGYVMTPRGRVIADEVRAMQEAALRVVQRLDAQPGDAVTPRGLVRITTSRPLADLFIVPRLGEFHRTYPEIDLSLLVENRNVSLARHEADVALLPHFIAAGDAALRPIDLGALPPERELWLLLRPDGANVPRIRAVADALADLFKREAALFTAPGTTPRSRLRNKTG